MLRFTIVAVLVTGVGCAKDSYGDAGAPPQLADAGGFLLAKCEAPFAASDLSAAAAIALEEFMTSDRHTPCPAVGCDSTVAIPWCGPFERFDGGFNWIGGLLASDDLSVIQLSAFRGQLYFAAPHVDDPRSVRLKRIVAHVLVPDRVGPFQTRAQGFGMISDAGIAEPPTRCFSEFAETNLRVLIPGDWRYYWRPVTYNGWAYCGPVRSQLDGGD